MKNLFYVLLSYLAPLLPRRKPPSLGGRLLTGYGRVNCWASGGKQALRRDICRCAANGVAIYHIEMAGWADTSAYRLVVGSDERMRETKALYTFAVGLCRSFGMWMFVSIVNDNMGSRKYGDPGVPLSKAMSEAADLAACVRNRGKDNVLVQPVGETQTAAGAAFTAYCLRDLHGFTFVNNAGSRPSSSAGMQHFAWHPFKTADIAKAPRGALIVSDTGSIIQELGHGLDGAGKPDHLKAYVAACRKAGARAAIYYAFKRRAHDSAAIEAMGA